jgi:hypothetical protein
MEIHSGWYEDKNKFVGDSFVGFYFCPNLWFTFSSTFVSILVLDNNNNINTYWDLLN